MKTILVPTDFSKNANNALKYAVAISKKENAKIILLHAFQIKQDMPDMLVMSTHLHNLIEKFFGTSITQKMAYHTKIPLIVFHYKK